MEIIQKKEYLVNIAIFIFRQMKIITNLLIDRSDVYGNLFETWQQDSPEDTKLYSRDKFVFGSVRYKKRHWISSFPCTSTKDMR